MRFTLEVDTDNDAFMADDELPRILRDVADKLPTSNGSGLILDSNGNRVGSWGYVDD